MVILRSQNKITHFLMILDLGMSLQNYKSALLLVISRISISLHCNTAICKPPITKWPQLCIHRYERFYILGLDEILQEPLTNKLEAIPPHACVLVAYQTKENADYVNSIQIDTNEQSWLDKRPTLAECQPQHSIGLSLRDIVTEYMC